jgi:hypothetical protein
MFTRKLALKNSQQILRTLNYMCAKYDNINIAKVGHTAPP